MKKQRAIIVDWGSDSEMSYGPRNFFRESMIIHAIKKYVQSPALVLDAGCGNGTLLTRLVQNKYFVYGCDLSQKSLKNTKNALHQLGLTRRSKIFKANLYKIPLQNNTINAIVCGEVLEHLLYDTKAIKEFFRLLKKNGYCIVSVPARPEKWDTVDNYSGHVRRYTQEELVNDFQKAGFEVISSFYWGFPLTDLWHKYIYTPCLDSLMRQKASVKTNTFISYILRTNKIVQLLSWIFYLDFLFLFTKKGNSLLLIAKKV